MYGTTDYLALSNSLASSGTVMIIALVLGLIGAIVAGILYIGKGKIERYTGFQRWLSEHLNFNKYLLSSILKVLYAFGLVYFIVSGIGTMFAVSFWAGLVMMLAGPIALRLSMELVMVILSIREEVATTNQLLREKGGMPPPPPPQNGYARPQAAQPTAQQPPAQQQPMQQRRPAPPQSYPTMQEFSGQYAPVRPQGQAQGYQAPQGQRPQQQPAQQEAPRARRIQRQPDDYNTDV